ncbi:MAG: DUF21 domain-containing protein [Bacilli bacterium]|nr:DUF21 domain-containing protein [Bacilli bacterium]
MKRQNKKKKLIDYGWIVKIIISSFLISVIFSLISEIAIPNVGIVMGILLTLIFILIGVIFDMVGIAVATADESQFHSMAARRVKGAKMALKLKKNADKVSSFCNDVVGDICGIVSGSTGAVIAIKIAENSSFNNLVVVVIIMGIISSLTIGGKALEKGYAMKKSNNILFNFSKILSIFSKK